MTIIKMRTADQELICVQEPIVASGDVGTVSVEYELDTYWDGFTPCGSFYTDKQPKNVFEQPLQNGACVIPWEVLQEEGVLYIGLRGVNADGLVKTAAPCRYRIKNGSPGATGENAEPTPDAFELMLQMTASAKESATNAENSAKDAETAASNAKSAANTAATTAAEAKTTAAGAHTAAAEAKTAATGAQTAAAEAKTAATGAQTKAAAAETTAAEAKTAATGAQTKAAAAETAANNVTATANAAQSTANTAKALAEAAQAAAGALKIQTGTYTGTGSYGASNKNSLTFNFAPKIVFIFGNINDTVGLMTTGHGYQRALVSGNGSGMDNTYNRVSWSGNTMSWYDSADKSQMNIDGCQYNYIAIG